MKPRACAIATLFMFLLSSAAVAAHPATVRITVTSGKSIAYSSGTILDGERGLILTCAHCVSDYKKNNLTVEIFDRRDRVIVTAYGIPVAVDTEHDMAIVRIRPKLSSISTYVAATSEVPKPGDRVRVAGCVRGGIPETHNTRITSVGTNLFTDSVQSQGTSGGGLYNYKGRLIGVIYATGVNQSIGIHSPIVHVHRLIQTVALKMKWVGYTCSPFG